MFEESLICKYAIDKVLNSPFSYSKVAHEMDMVCHADKTISTFEEAWSKYASTILQYSMTHSLRNKEVKESLMPLIDDLPDNQSALEFGM